MLSLLQIIFCWSVNQLINKLLQFHFFVNFFQGSTVILLVSSKTQESQQQVYFRLFLTPYIGRLMYIFWFWYSWLNRFWLCSCTHQGMSQQTKWVTCEAVDTWGPEPKRPSWFSALSWETKPQKQPRLKHCRQLNIEAGSLPNTLSGGGDVRRTSAASLP